MKKILLGLSILGVIIYVAVSVNKAILYKNTYKGEYQSSNNTILIIGSNNKCTIIQNLYKDAFYTYGKYKIDGNKIYLFFNKKNQNYIRTSKVKGYIEWNSIKVYDAYEHKYSIYIKE